MPFAAIHGVANSCLLKQFMNRQVQFIPVSAFFEKETPMILSNVGTEMNCTPCMN